MQAFRLQNFRGFIDTGWIELKPLTLLVGANSTGKSSLLRFLPLLRQSMATETGVPFAWAKEGGVDLGTAQDVHRRGATEPMRVGIKVTTQGYLSSPDRSGRLRRLKGVPIEYELGMDCSSPVGELTEFSIHAGNRKSTNSISREHPTTEGVFETHDKRLGGVAFRSGVVPDALRLEGSVLPEILAMALSTGHPQFAAVADEVEGALPLTRLKESFLLRMLHLPPIEFRQALETWVLSGQTVTTNDEQLATVQAKLWDIMQGQLLAEVREVLTGWSQFVEYIGPARFPPMRYHRMWAERPRRLMPDGANIAVLFGGMSPADREAFNSFLHNALGYTLAVRSGSGNAELTLTNAEGDTFNIADLGFGLSQVLPVYLQAHLAQPTMPLTRVPTSLFVVEQPELHLHPQLQAKLAELFVGMSARSDHNTIPVPCFVETHSKALLERTGELIEEGAIPAKDVQVLLFEKDGKNCTVRATTFDEQGILRDWPVGFLSR